MVDSALLMPSPIDAGGRTAWPREAMRTVSCNLALAYRSPARARDRHSPVRRRCVTTSDARATGASCVRWVPCSGAVAGISRQPWCGWHRRATGQPSTDPALELARSRDPGIVTLLRHAPAPGVGDPAGFSLDDCATQRNLSEEGREDARASARRCARSVSGRPTSAAASGAAASKRRGSWRSAPFGRELPEFLLRRPGRRVGVDASIRAAVLQKLDSRRPTFFVTHQVNITALTGIVPAEGEAIFVRATAAGTIEVVGRARLP